MFINFEAFSPISTLIRGYTFIRYLFLSADSFSSTLPVVSSRGEGEGELFDKVFVAFVFQLKPGILALNQVVSLETSTWIQN